MPLENYLSTARICKQKQAFQVGSSLQLSSVCPYFGQNYEEKLFIVVFLLLIPLTRPEELDDLMAFGVSLLT